jgi:glycosyltransferase involved in cell wall biosynthesis
VEAFVLRHADAIVTISEHSRRQLLEFGVDPDRVFVVYPGVEPPAEGRQPWVEAWPSGDALRLLFVGRLIERKRPHLAVQTLERLLRTGTPSSLVLAGEGPLSKKLHGLVRSCGLDKSVAFLGRISEADKWRLLAAADVFLFPSELEGFGFAAAEAQRCGVPVVAAAGTATSEIVMDGESGFVVGGQPEPFAEAAARLLDPHLRRRFGQRAQELSQRFDWDTSASLVADIYAKVVMRFRDGTTAPGPAAAGQRA